MFKSSSSDGGADVSGSGGILPERSTHKHIVSITQRSHDHGTEPDTPGLTGASSTRSDGATC